MYNSHLLLNLTCCCYYFKTLLRRTKVFVKKKKLWKKVFKFWQRQKIHHQVMPWTRHQPLQRYKKKVVSFKFNQCQFKNILNFKKTPLATEVVELRRQLGTLSSSMSVLTSEKSRMETNYQAEKRALRVSRGVFNTNHIFCCHMSLRRWTRFCVFVQQEYEERESRYEEDLSQLHATVEDLEAQLNTVSTKSCT